MKTSEVTDNQISALYYVVSNGLVPYADFAVWGPYGTRFERKNAVYSPVNRQHGILEIHGSTRARLYRVMAHMLAHVCGGRNHVWSGNASNVDTL